MQTLSQLPEEGQRDIARSLGYMGKKVGFPAFLQSNPSAAKEYQDIEEAFRRNQMFAQERKMSMAEGGMYMGRFDQRQGTEGVGSFVPPPRQSFQEGGTPVQTYLQVLRYKQLVLFLLHNKI